MIMQLYTRRSEALLSFTYSLYNSLRVWRGHGYSCSSKDGEKGEKGPHVANIGKYEQ
jgi:hypothetical protein